MCHAKSSVSLAMCAMSALSKKPGPMIYVPFAQAPLYGGEVVVRSSLGVSRVGAVIRQAVRSIDRNLPVRDIESFFGGIALVLGAVGVFGVVSHSVSQRTHEIGIRMAVGAQRRDVMRLILGQGVKLALLGLGIGVVFAFLLTRLIASLLYDSSATDPLTFGAVAIVLFGVAVIACYIPARRAVRVDARVVMVYH
jgi:putative ABC transport system permease protein